MTNAGLEIASVLVAILPAQRSFAVRLAIAELADVFRSIAQVLCAAAFIPRRNFSRARGQGRLSADGHRKTENQDGRDQKLFPSHVVISLGKAPFHCAWGGMTREYADIRHLRSKTSDPSREPMSASRFGRAGTCARLSIHAPHSE